MGPPRLRGELDGASVRYGPKLLASARPDRILLSPMRQGAPRCRPFLCLLPATGAARRLGAAHRPSPLHEERMKRPPKGSDRNFVASSACDRPSRSSRVALGRRKRYSRRLARPSSPGTPSALVAWEGAGCARLCPSRESTRALGRALGVSESIFVGGTKHGRPFIAAASPLRWGRRPGL